MGRLVELTVSGVNPNNLWSSLFALRCLLNSSLNRISLTPWTSIFDSFGDRKEAK
jgi:hypothetical protein